MVLELPAPAAGVIAQIVKADGGTVVSGEVIAMIDTDADSAAAAASGGRAAARHRWRRRQNSSPDQSNLHAGRAQDGRGQQARPQVDCRQRPRRPRDQGRCHRRTWRAPQRPAPAAAAPATAAASPALPGVPAPINVDKLLAGRPEQRVPMSRLRARVAERLLQSQATAAILTTFNEVNMQPVMDLRKRSTRTSSRKNMA